MISLRAKFTGLSVAIFIAGLALLLVFGTLLLEPWFTISTRSDFERIRNAMETGKERSKQELTRMAQDLAKGTGYKVVIANEAGIVTISSSPEFKPNDMFPLPKEEQDFIRTNRPNLVRGRVYFGILRAPAPGLSTIHLVTEFGTGSYLVVSQSLDQLHKPITMASGFFLLAGIVILFLEFAAFLVLSNSIVRPIRKLTSVAEAVANGEYSARFEAHVKTANGLLTDEFDVLGQSINQMATKLSGHISELAAINVELANKIKAQEDFLAGASHELKTPIGLVRGYAEALKLGYWTNERERDELADTILNEADHLTRLVRDLSFISIGASAGKALLLEEGNLAELAIETSMRFSREAAAKGYRISLEAPETATTRFDAGRIKQALDNLLSNAIRHAEGDGHIRIGIVDIGSQWRIEVCNPGKPIPPAQLSRLFEPFYRVEASRNRGNGGSGLGLAAVQHIAKSHGGHCGIENAANGVKAWISVPKKNNENAC